MSKELILTKGKVAIVDDEDFEYLNQWKWTYLPGKNDRGYAYRRKTIEGKYRCIYLHRFIMQTPEDMDTDHINGDPLDNRRENLRICTTAENLANRTKLTTRNTTGYKGVCFDKKKGLYYAQIGWQRKGIRKNFVIGYFTDPKKAAKAYEEEALQRYGEFAKLELLGGSH
jgi:hypothetical protein